MKSRVALVERSECHGLVVKMMCVAVVAVEHHWYYCYYYCTIEASLASSSWSSLMSLLMLLAPWWDCPWTIAAD